jgi:elongation factor Ts
MASFSAADVKKLRDATGAGMMDCKRALEEADGDFERAVEILRTKAGAKVARRDAERTASNGLVAAAEGAMIELACETDFVAKGEDFQTLAGDIVAHLANSDKHEASSGAHDPVGLAQQLLGETLKDGKTVAENIDAVAARIGEKLELRRAVKLSGQVATYLHKKASDLPAQVGVLVQYAGEDLGAARGAAMQIAAMRPRFLAREDVPAETIETERRIAEAKAREEGKPEAALSKIVDGMVNGFYKGEFGVLLEQSAVQDNKKTVKALLDEAGITVTGFAHFEIG